MADTTGLPGNNSPDSLGYQSGQGGVARVTCDQDNGEYPSGNGECRSDAKTAGAVPYRTGAPGQGPTWPGHETLGDHDGSTAPYAGESRTSA
jgi:hypothetical protein